MHDDKEGRGEEEEKERRGKEGKERSIEKYRLYIIVILNAPIQIPSPPQAPFFYILSMVLMDDNYHWGPCPES